MVENTMDNLLMAKKKAKELSDSQMVTNILVDLRMVKWKVMEYT
jgi:hypothetical protein